jgi:hypothetical protein
VTAAYAPLTRIRLATEAAAAKSIEAMLTEVSKVRLE